MRPPRGSSPHPVWGQLQQLQTDMNHLFDRWTGEGRRFLGLADYPLFNVWEEAEAVCVEAELPGLNLEDLEIYVTAGNQLTVKGVRKPSVPEKGVWHRQERAFGGFNRLLTLPYPVDPDKVEARFENGVLALRLHKHESARPRKIPVKSV